MVDEASRAVNASAYETAEKREMFRRKILVDDGEHAEREGRRSRLTRLRK
jgi:hypothetical protein